MPDFRFQANMTNFAKELERNTPERMVSSTANTYVNSIRQAILASAPKGKLSGVGTNARRKTGGARIGVKKNTKDALHAVVQATGPLHLIERDTAAHTIPRTVSSRRTRTSTGRLSVKRESTGRRLNGAIFLGNKAKHFAATGPVTRPATRGKHPFERGANAAERAMQLENVKQLAAAMSKFFKAG